MLNHYLGQEFIISILYNNIKCPYQITISIGEKVI